MKLPAQNILREYPYFFDGQFVHENIQSALIKQFLKNIESDRNDFIRVTETVLVHARILPWDTDHFGMPMARIEHFFFKDAETIDNAYNDLLSWLTIHNIRHISVRLNLNNRKAINFLAHRGYEIMVGKLMLRTDTVKTEAMEMDKKNYTVSSLIADNEINMLVNISSGNFRENRFIFDQYLNQDKSTAVYEHWVQNEVKKNPENLTVIRNTEAIVGFSLIEKVVIADTTVGFVNLIAVDQKFQGKELGRTLLSDALSKFKMSGIRSVYANVVSTNYPSLTLFQSCGFRIYSNVMELRKYNG